jgi:RNA polymerase sigma-70 factor (ECF subfamily)
VELRDDHALSAVDHECAELREERQFAEIDFLLNLVLEALLTNHARKWWDSDRRRRRRELRASERTSDRSSTPDEDLEQREHHEQLYAALGGLPAKLREAFVARVIEGMSLQEAGEALEVPISTVSYRTRRAEDLLCAALEIETSR